MGQEFVESSGLGFCFKHSSVKARDGVRERNFGFPRRGHFVMKVILGNAQILPPCMLIVHGCSWSFSTLR